MFHLEKVENYFIKNQENKSDLLKNNIICPADLCVILNCGRYKNFLNIIKDDKKYLKNKNTECNPLLENFYSRSCMILINGCFSKEDIMENYKFFMLFCRRKKCIENELNLSNIHINNNEKNNINQEFYKDSSFLNILYSILIYLITIFSFIYMLILWITKYSS